MDKTKKKRLQRIERIDQKRLDAATTELRECNQILEQRKQLRLSMRQRLATSLHQLHDSQSAAINNHAIEWASNSQATLTQLDEHIESLEMSLDELRERVRQQSATVKGWQFLLEKIEAEEIASSEKDAIYQADDRVLSKLVTKNGSSK
jgi:flagellar biosynthesis chaperone FliJ